MTVYAASNLKLIVCSDWPPERDRRAHLDLLGFSVGRAASQDGWVLALSRFAWSITYNYDIPVQSIPSPEKPLGHGSHWKPVSFAGGGKSVQVTPG